jgi:hypothetical protein
VCYVYVAVKPSHEAQYPHSCKSKLETHSVYLLFDEFVGSWELGLSPTVLLVGAFLLDSRAQRAMEMNQTCAR